MKKPKKKTENKQDPAWEGCDDCAICQAMKDGTSNTVEGLMQAFEKANQDKGIPSLYSEELTGKNCEMAMRIQDINDLYYDAMEAIDAGYYKEAEKMLNKAKEIDEDCVQTYIGFVHLYGTQKQQEEAREFVKIAFNKTKKHFPKWPKKMLWGVIENRAYLRAIYYQADLFLYQHNIKEAESLYRLLLQLNPGDNQGIRYVLAGVYAGIDGREIDKMFDEGNKKQDWSKLENLFRVQNKKHKFWKEPKE